MCQHTKTKSFLLLFSTHYTHVNTLKLEFSIFVFLYTCLDTLNLFSCFPTHVCQHTKTRVSLVFPTHYTQRSTVNTLNLFSCFPTHLCQHTKTRVSLCFFLHTTHMCQHTRTRVFSFFLHTTHMCQHTKTRDSLVFPTHYTHVSTH